MSALLNISPDTLAYWIVNNNPVGVASNVKLLLPNLQHNYLRMNYETFSKIMMQQGALMNSKEEAGAMLVRVLNVPLLTQGLFYNKLSALSQESGYSVSDIVRYVFLGSQQSKFTFDDANNAVSTESANANQLFLQKWFVTISLLGGFAFAVFMVFRILKVLFKALKA